jgi:hypothetical protein
MKKKRLEFCGGFLLAAAIILGASTDSHGHFSLGMKAFAREAKTKTDQLGQSHIIICPDAKHYYNQCDPGSASCNPTACPPAQ